jgi:Predicted S-adenosylmethionine-dependent methyltransferase
LNCDSLLVAIEKEQNAMIIALERAKKAELNNIRFVDADVAGITEMFDKGEVSRIYVNFCDPWPKSRDAKFRLTAPSFLRKYADVLELGGEIQFKTDNAPLFDWSIEQFKNEGWELPRITYNLHEKGPNGIMTDYEAKFYAEGMKINALTAVKNEKTKVTTDGEVPRLRNAALSDARGHQEK